MPNITEYFIDKTTGIVTIEYDDGSVVKGEQLIVTDNGITNQKAIDAIGAVASSGGQSFKTINGQSIVGTGDLVITGGSNPTLKTINGQTILGTGDIVITNPVTSVAGKTGAVSLDKSDVGLTNVDNTSDVNKPVSTAQNAAISAKYTKPGTGIPLTDLSSSVQSSIAKADTALQSITLKTINGQSIVGTGDISIASGGTGSSLPTQISYSTVVPLDGNKYMPRTAVQSAVQFTVGSVTAGGVCKVALVSNGVNTPTFGNDINIDAAGDTFSITNNRLNNLWFWNDGDVNWVTIQDTGINVTLPATALVISSSPTSGVVNTASSNITVTANGSLASAVTVTPSSTLSGTFSPSSAVLNNNGSVVFTFTPTVTGSNTISFSASGLTSTNFAYNVTAAPTVPSAVLNVLAGTTTASTQALSWTVPSSNGGSAITDYVVQYSLAGSNNWVTFSDGVSTGTNTTVTGLTSSTNYDYRVAAINGVGTGAYSTVVSKATSAAATVPGAPTNVVATAGDAQASVAFTAPASNGGSAITGYTVTASTGQTASGSTSPIVVTGLTNGTSVTFTVVATNSVGNSSASAASNSVTPQAAAVSYTISGFSGNTIKSTYDGSGAESGTFDGLKAIASPNLSTNGYWTISPDVASARAGWSQSSTVPPAETNETFRVNGLIPMNKPGAFYMPGSLWVAVGTGTSTWYYWIKPLNGTAQMVGSCVVTGV
jgi:trimeric autotransporter adhesin